jgi:hypothetical protein
MSTNQIRLRRTVKRHDVRAASQRFASTYGLDVKLVRGVVDANWYLGHHRCQTMPAALYGEPAHGATEKCALEILVTYLARIPAMTGSIGFGYFDDGGWWVKFTIDSTHRFAWHAIQELGYVVNYLSLEERVPTVFMPVSPPPYLHGGPDKALAWVIECHDKMVRPATFKKWVEGQLPNPVDDDASWAMPQ